MSLDPCSRRKLLLTLAQSIALSPLALATAKKKTAAVAHKSHPATTTTTVHTKKGPAVIDPSDPTLHNPKLQGLKETDLVSLADVDPTIIIDIVFSQPDNPFHYQFFKENVAYVRLATARKIAAVQREFMKRGLRLKAWSTYRPMPVQIKMYDIVDHNGDWVSDPYEPNSKKAHVRGVAIDCTLVDESGKELDMPTSYLDFKNYKKMWRTYMDLPKHVIENRTLIKEVMNHHGMNGYSKEWWHFQDDHIMDYPAIKFSDFPELHKQMLVEEMIDLWREHGMESTHATRTTKAKTGEAGEAAMQ